MDDYYSPVRRAPLTGKVHADDPDPPPLPDIHGVYYAPHVIGQATDPHAYSRRTIETGTEG